MKMSRHKGKTLSRYELAVMTFVVSGYSFKQIAYTLHKSHEGIKSTVALSRHKIRLNYGPQVPTDIFHMKPLIEDEWARLKEEKMKDLILSDDRYSSLEELLELADEIGGKIERGDLPRQDENGFYILP